MRRGWAPIVGLGRGRGLRSLRSDPRLAASQGLDDGLGPVRRATATIEVRRGSRASGMHWGTSRRSRGTRVPRASRDLGAPPAHLRPLHGRAGGAARTGEGRTYPARLVEGADRLVVAALSDGTGSVVRRTRQSSRSSSSSSSCLGSASGDGVRPASPVGRAHLWIRGRRLSHRPSDPTEQQQPKAPSDGLEPSTPCPRPGPTMITASRG